NFLVRSGSCSQNWDNRGHQVAPGHLVACRAFPHLSLREAMLKYHARSGQEAGDDTHHKTTDVVQGQGRVIASARSEPVIAGSGRGSVKDLLPGEGNQLWLARRPRGGHEEGGASAARQIDRVRGRR